MSHIKTAVIVLIIAMILSLVLTYASIMTIVQTTKSNTERVLNSFVTQNATYIYSSIKNGNDFTSVIDANYFIFQFSSDRTLDFDGKYFYNRDRKGDYNFRMTTPQTAFTVNNTLNLTCAFDILIPIDFAEKRVTELIIPIQVKTSYNIKN
jgi:hypothetical protein